MQGPRKECGPESEPQHCEAMAPPALADRSGSAQLSGPISQELPEVVPGPLNTAQKGPSEKQGLWDQGCSSVGGTCLGHETPVPSLANRGAVIAVQA